MPSTELVFKLKKMFPEEDILTEWILNLSVMRNDISYILKSWIYMINDEERKSGEFLYISRIIFSHFREGVKLFGSDIDAHPQITSFINKLSNENKTRFNLIRSSCHPFEQSFVKTYLDKLRNYSFHYPSKKINSSNFKEDYSELVDFFTKLIINNSGNTRADIDLRYADDMILNIVFGQQQQQLESIMNTITGLLNAYIHFIDDAIGTYFVINKNRISFPIYIRN